MTKQTHGGARKGSGRKPEDGAVKPKRYNVTLDSETVRMAKAIGGGSLSVGIRKSVRDN